MTKNPNKSFTITMSLFPHNIYYPEWKFKVFNAQTEYTHSVVLYNKLELFPLLLNKSLLVVSKIWFYNNGEGTDIQYDNMMTSSNGNMFRVTGPLCGQFTGLLRIPHTNASDAELWRFLWSAPEQTAEQTIETLVIWDAITLNMTSQ